jgi:hypothetical protein
MVDFDAALGEFLEIPLGESASEVPAHRDQDDFRRESVPSECRHRGLDCSDETTTLHSDSLVQPRLRH